MGWFGKTMWFILCGMWQALAWSLAGVFWCITIVGIPMGKLCFRYASVVAFPARRELCYEKYGSGENFPFFFNFFWTLLSGLPLAAAAILNGFILCFTVIGMPLGFMCAKFARLALMPFNVKVIQKY